MTRLFHLSWKKNRRQYYPDAFVRFYRSTDTDEITQHFEWLYPEEKYLSVVWFIFEGTSLTLDIPKIHLSVQAIFKIPGSNREKPIFRCIRCGYKPVDCEPTEDALNSTLNWLYSQSTGFDPLISRIENDLKYDRMIMSVMTKTRDKYYPGELITRARDEVFRPTMGPVMWVLGDLNLGISYEDGRNPTSFMCLRESYAPAVKCEITESALEYMMDSFHELFGVVKFQFPPTPTTPEEKQRVLTIMKRYSGDLSRKQGEIQKEQKRREAEILKKEQQRWDSLPEWRKFLSKRP